MRASTRPAKGSAVTGSAAADERDVADVVAVRGAVVRTHRLALLILTMGFVVYVAIAIIRIFIWLSQRNQKPSMQSSFQLTLPTDTALGLLGVGATLLVALVATIWTSSAAADQRNAPVAKGRRQVQYALTIGTGGGLVVAALAAAAHQLGPQTNFVALCGFVGVSLASAWIAADVAALMADDKSVSDELTEYDGKLLAKRLAAASANWRKSNDISGWRQPKRPRLRAVVDFLTTVLLLGVLQSVVLGAWGGGSALRGYLSWFVVALIVSTLIARRVVGYLVIVYVTQALSQLMLPLAAVLGFGLIPMVVVLQGTSSLDRHSRVPLVVALLLCIATVVVPVLLTALAIRSGGRWSVAWWLPSSRARVLRALHEARRQADAAAAKPADVNSDPVWRWLQRCITAARRARGSLPAG